MEFNLEKSREKYMDEENVLNFPSQLFYFIFSSFPFSLPF